MSDAAWKPETAERSIRVFERIHGLEVTVHDVASQLGAFLRPDRSHHRAAACVAVKAGGFLPVCMQFDIDHVRRELGGLPEGRIHVCPAGLVEWVVPVFQRDELCWMLFAGVRRPGPDLRSAVRPSAFPASGASALTTVPEVQEAQARLILEHLRQLAARLQFWCEEGAAIREGTSRPVTKEEASSAAARRIVIARFIDENYAGTATLAMLAQRLNLSEGRASHVVRESCNRNFRDLLVQKRLHVAKELLCQSGMSVAEVALASGFDDVAHFHRLFRRHVGHTPSQHRVTGRS